MSLSAIQPFVTLICKEKGDKMMFFFPLVRGEKTNFPGYCSWNHPERLSRRNIIVFPCIVPFMYLSPPPYKIKRFMTLFKGVSYRDLFFPWSWIENIFIDIKISRIAKSLVFIAWNPFLFFSLLSPVGKEGKRNFVFSSPNPIRNQTLESKVSFSFSFLENYPPN